MSTVSISTDTLELEVTGSPCKDHGDEPSDVESRTASALLHLEEKLTALQKSQSDTTERNNILEAEIKQLREKRESDKQKMKTLSLAHEKFDRMKAEYKEMSKFIKAHKDEVEAAKAKVEQQQSPPSTPPPQPKSEAVTEYTTTKRHANAFRGEPQVIIRGEPCLTLTRSEVCRLEQDVLALRELLSRREERWRRTKAREVDARKKLAAVSMELATVRHLAQMRRNQSDELAHRLQESLLELKKHKTENTKLRQNIVRLRNRERSLLTSLTKKSKNASTRSDRKKGRQQHKKSGSQKQTKCSSVQATPRQGPGEVAPKGILRVLCCSPRT